MAGIIDELVQALGESQVLVGDAISQRATSYWDQSPTTAKALLRPRSTEDVSAAMKICHERGQTVVTHGGLTGCVQGAVASPDEVIISLERMNTIEAVDSQGGTATVQAGVILEVLQQNLAEQDLLFPLDLGARGSCTIGGNISTNAGGINVLRYGMMRSLVLGLEVVTADGTVISSMNQMLKNNAGYDLKQLFIGSEGTLGIVTRAVLKLFPKPLSCDSALVAVEKFADVVTLLNQLQRDLAGTLSAYEVMWGEYFRGVTGDDGHRAPMSRDYPFYVMVEAEGADQAADSQRFEQLLENSLMSGIIVDAVIPKSEAERRALWDIREDFEVILPGYLYDVSLPIREMDAYIQQVMHSVQEKWPNSACYVLGHVADGNLHLFVQPGEDGDLHAASDELVYSPLDKLEGSVSAEHGIGTEKLGWLSHSRSAEEIAMMRLMKNSLDPKGLLNPGRVLGETLFSGAL
jgi:FAD/FMN-containing dehydrogenase